MPSKNTKTADEGAKPEATAEATAKPAAPMTPAAANGKHILIVEDERPLSHALEMKLKNQGYDTHVVMNGADALTEVKAGKYDLILLDLIMPIMDGFAVLAELKNQKSKIPVIVLSNLGQDEDRSKTKELGAVDYFVKSNTPIADIVARVKTAL